MLLARQGLKNFTLSHIPHLRFHTLHPNYMSLLLNLPSPRLTQSVKRVNPCVLSQNQRNLLKSVSEASDSVLLYRSILISDLPQINRTIQLDSTSPHDHLRITKQVSDYANSIVDRPVCLVDDSLTTTSDQNTYSFSLTEFFDNSEIIIHSPETHLLDHPSEAELVWVQLLESWNDSGAGSHSE